MNIFPLRKILPANLSDLEMGLLVILAVIQALAAVTLLALLLFFVLHLAFQNG